MKGNKIKMLQSCLDCQGQAKLHSAQIQKDYSLVMTSTAGLMRESSTLKEVAMQRRSICLSKKNLRSSTQSNTVLCWRMFFLRTIQIHSMIEWLTIQTLDSLKIQGAATLLLIFPEPSCRQLEAIQRI